MENTTRLLLPEVVDALNSDPQDLLALTEELHPADLADLTHALEPELALELLTILPVDSATRLLEQCEDEDRTSLFAGIAEKAMPTAAAITGLMAADDRADLIAALSPELRASLLDQLDEEESRDIRQLLAYEEDTAGALLTTDFVALPATATSEEAIAIVRRDAQEMETIYQAYAVDPHGTLLGAVSLRDLVLSPAHRTIDELMEPNIVTVAVDADQEEAARLIAKYDLLALPVVDRSHRIVGIVTVDDIIDVVEEEATEDVQKLGAVEPLELPYNSTPIWHLVRARAPWLVVLFVGSLATRNLLEYYTTAHASAIMLSWFIPLVVSSGGNSGSQSASLIIRALALGRITPSDARRVLGRELIVGVSLGLLISTVGALSALAWESTRIPGLVMTIGFALVSVVTVGALFGSGIPLLLQRLGIDPAVSSTPFIASVLDLAGLVIFFEIGRIFFL